MAHSHGIIYRSCIKVVIPARLVEQRAHNYIQSVKWVGFFVTALVGLYTIGDLWNLLGDVHMPKVSYNFSLLSPT